jgi:hypothetical protein
VTVADDQLAEFGPELDAWDREDAAASVRYDGLPECARDALALLEAVRPIIPIALKLGAGQAPGVDAAQDASWAASLALARRRVLAQLAAGIDHGLANDSLRLLDRIGSMVGERSDDWNDLCRRQVREHVAASRRGRQRGQALRERGQETEAQADFTVGWLLRHPTDHCLHLARTAIGDSKSRALIENQIIRLAPSYQELCDLDWATQEAAADVICEMEVLAAPPGGWTEPMRAAVTVPIEGNASLDEHVAVRFVKDIKGPFNGTLVSVLAGERWLICARELEDGTLLPLDGTRRRATSGVRRPAGAVGAA